MRSRIAVPATFSQFSPTMPAARKTAPQTGGVMVDKSANQKTKICAKSRLISSCCSAGPAIETQIT